jgi:hypothetical protein
MLHLKGTPDELTRKIMQVLIEEKNIQTTLQLILHVCTVD